MIVKFGHSCLSTASKSKQDDNKLFLYVFKHESLEQTTIDATLELISGCDELNDETWIYIDTTYYFNLKDRIKGNIGRVIRDGFEIVPHEESSGTILMLNRKFEDKAAKTCLYVGDCSEDSTLHQYFLPNLKLGHFEAVYAVDPVQNTIEKMQK